MNRGMWLALLLPLLGVAGPRPALAQHPPALAGAAERFVRMWEEGDVEGLGSLLRPEGIRLHLDGEAHPDLTRRQAVAALRHFLGEYVSVELRTGRVVEVGGTPPEGFAEIRWRAVPAGTTDLRETTIYVGFVLMDEAWRVMEIRVLH